MLAGRYKITCEQGATFRRNFTIYQPSLPGASALPVNLTGYSARMQVRPEVESDTVLVELTTENGRITLGGVNGTLLMQIEAAITSMIASDGVYDLEIYNSDDEVYRVIKGKFIVDPEVTRDV